MIARLLAAAVMASAVPAFGQAPEIVRDMAGNWQVLPVDGRPGCTIMLTAKSAGAESWAAKPEASCATRLPALKNVNAWRLQDGVALLAGPARVALSFIEDETTLLSSPDLIAPKYYMIRAIAGFTHVPQAGELAGEWTITQGRTACSIRLQGGAIGQSGTRVAKPAPACTGTARKLDHWWFEGLTLLIGGPDDRLVQFHPTGDTRFAGESTGPNGAPIARWSLTRPVRAKGS
ncbi:AprI/Inh family metalloprotease inhibitor [Glacieibacterium frigidum]|uniref:Alkaline proteinase inhibitor/ Outer membrane lipoprotein Omp19 domain-containing protein n=1 Tax=Glacieibacterium frigidum TaxID=2593303 RepID=A0A552UAE4_9SPHN|nr:AprI/Inh family metalloprotease inhibitor [Glacieibacterium frigidum]TRW15169.1 hypothetical protein FMM06_16150 [Glacieibacterium frigidum]